MIAMQLGDCVMWLHPIELDLRKSAQRHFEGDERQPRVHAINLTGVVSVSKPNRLLKMHQRKQLVAQSIFIRVLS